MIERDAAGFPLGQGIFETIKTVDGKVIALGRHMRRALKSAEACGFSIPGEEELRSAILEILDTKPQAVGRLRLCFAEDFFDITHEKYEEVTTTARVNFYSPTVSGLLHKRYPYDERLFILEQARLEGFDESLLFNSRNQICEAATANVIFLIDGQWITPPLSAGILPGVMRALAIEKCGVKVDNIHISQVSDISAGLLVSSLRVAQTIAYIGDMKLKIDQDCEYLASQIRASAMPDSVG